MQENLMSAEIDQLDIAAGLKELLVSKGFTNSDEIIKIDADELASIFGIDPNVAKLVRFAAKKTSPRCLASLAGNGATLRDGIMCQNVPILNMLQ
jgi:hypothetical protein